MTEHNLAEIFNAAGIKIVSLVFAFIGAGLGISYSPELSKRQALFALLSGLTIGSLAPEGVRYFMPGAPQVVLSLTAVVFGIGGMFIVPGIIVAWRGFRDDPWAFFDKLRKAFGRSDGGAQ